jgi:hypothetical protein
VPIEEEEEFSINPQISNFMKIRPAGADLFHADGRTDKMKLIVAFRNFVDAPKMGNKYQRNEVSNSELFEI